MEDVAETIEATLSTRPTISQKRAFDGVPI
jgi:hypothetical protein